MGTRTEHAPGTFSYVDLSTTDPDGAKAFYGELFGWDFDDQEVGDGRSTRTAASKGQRLARSQGRWSRSGGWACRRTGTTT